LWERRLNIISPVQEELDLQEKFRIIQYKFKK